MVLPGNPKNPDPYGYVEDDIIHKPKGGQGKGGAASGSGTDDFEFMLSNQELSDIYFDEMELPNLEDSQLKDADTVTWTKAGYVTEGSPSNLALIKTVKNSMGRRIAIGRPKQEEIDALEEQLENPDLQEDMREMLLDSLETLKKRFNAIPWLDPLDVRYRNLVSIPNPTSQAVMFCLMDCSGSMGQHEKDLAKRFYVLLYKFLTYKYKRVEVVFIRHTDEAKEVDEKEFFYGKETGGTVVSSAFREMLKIIRERYNVEDWNIYAAQASDGDNYSSDNSYVEKLLNRDIMPLLQYFAYIEVGEERQVHEWDGTGYQSAPRKSVLWQLYEKSFVPAYKKKFAIAEVRDRQSILSVFKKLFRKKNSDD